MATEKVLTRNEIQFELLKLSNKIRRLECDVRDPSMVALRDLSLQELQRLRARYREYNSVFRRMND